MNFGLLEVLLMVFASISLFGYVASRNSTVFWGRYQETFTEQARFNLADMFMFMDTKQLFRFNAAAIAVVPLLLWLLTGNLLLSAVALVLIMILPARIYRWLRQRRINRIQQQLPDALMMAAGSMRAGLGFAPALESLARDIEPPLAQEFALVLREQR